jgi:hypothetical protein
LPTIAGFTEQLLLFWIGLSSMKTAKPHRPRSWSGKCVCRLDYCGNGIKFSRIAAEF